jgi:hypothetical protein
MTPKYCKANSIPYREAGDRMRLSAERLVEARAGLRAHRVAAAVWGLTAGYSKAWDRVFIDGLAEMTGMDERSTRRGLKECEAAGALQWKATQWHHGTPSLVGLPTEAMTGPMQPGEAHTEHDRADAARSYPHEQVDAPTFPDSDRAAETGLNTGPMQPGYLEPRTDSADASSSRTYGRRELCVECGKRQAVNANLVCERCWKREALGAGEWVRDDSPST